MANRMYIVAYELPSSASPANREAIDNAIKASGHWWHYLEWTWLIVADKTANDLASEVSPYVKAVEGRFLVMEVAERNRQGLLPEKAWKWIRTWSKRIPETPN